MNTSKEFVRFIGEIIDIEGGYSNHLADSGGETKFGITKSVALKHGYTGNMKYLTKANAELIYLKEYWSPLSMDQLIAKSEKVAWKVLDIGVNMGPYRGAEFLQRILNVLNRNATDYPDIKVDGHIGPNTIAALDKFLIKRKKNGEVVILRGLNSLQGAFYITLAERREKDEAFVFGWLLQRVNSEG